MTATDTIDGPDAARAKSQGTDKTASLYRMAMPGHLCPFGLKSKSLLQRKGYDVDDNLLTTRDEVDAFKEAHDVKTTPITFIDGEQIGGYTDLKTHFGYRVLGKDDTTYAPIIAIFGSTALMALALVVNLYEGFPALTFLMWFFAISMVALAMQKLQDVEAFVNGFLGYDLLARRYVPYGYAYPFARTFRGRRHDGPDRHRQRADLACRSCRYLHRHHRDDQRDQGGLHRQARPEMRLRRRRIECTTGRDLALREPDNGGYGPVDAGNVGRRLTDDC